MKFIAFMDGRPEDFDKIAEKWKERIDKKETLKTTLFPPHMLGAGSKSFLIFESEDEEEILKWAFHYSPEMKVEITPIFELTIQLLKKMKK